MQGLHMFGKNMRRFHIVGGECNYLLRVGPAPERRLQFVPDREWKSNYMMSWRQADINAVLDEAGALLRATASHLRLPVTVRGPRVLHPLSALEHRDIYRVAWSVFVN